MRFSKAKILDHDYNKKDLDHDYNKKDLDHGS